MMTAPTEDVDWAVVERRVRWSRWLAAPGIAVVSLAYVVANDWDGVLGGALLWALPLLAVTVLGLVLVRERGPRRRRRAVEAQREELAVINL